MIIGLTGKNGAGKGEVAKFLQERGFTYHSLSDVLREEAAKEGSPVSRDVLVALGNRLRQEQGPGALAEKIFVRLDPEKHYVIDSVRHPIEIKVLRRRPDFILADVEAPEKLRFERLKRRNRENDPKNYDDFLKLEKREGASEVESDQQLNGAIAMADVKLPNEGALEELHQRVKELLLEFSKKQRRPD